MDGPPGSHGRSAQDIIRSLESDVADLQRDETAPTRALNLPANAEASSSRDAGQTARTSPVQPRDQTLPVPPTTGQPLHASGYPSPRTPQARALLHQALGPPPNRSRVLAHSDQELQHAPYWPEMASENRDSNGEFQVAARNRAAGDYIDGLNYPDTRQQALPRGAQTLPNLDHFGTILKDSQQPELTTRNPDLAGGFRLATQNRASGDPIDGGNHPDTHRQPRPPGAANLPNLQHFGPPRTAQEPQMASENRSTAAGFRLASQNRTSGDHTDGGNRTDTGR